MAKKHKIVYLDMDFHDVVTVEDGLKKKEAKERLESLRKEYPSVNFYIKKEE